MKKTLTNSIALLTLCSTMFAYSYHPLTAGNGDVYGADNDERLTGLHETCSIEEFRYGVSDRGASIRIPMQTSNDGFGYLEDRRPSANMDPYKVCAILIETTCS